MNEDVKKYLDKKFGVIDAKFEAIDERFNIIDGRFDALATRIDESQEELARMVSKSFDHSQGQFAEMQGLLHAIAEAVDADIPATGFIGNDPQTLQTHRKDIDNLARRVKALEGKKSKRT